jgi:hypothetical protein
MKPLHIILIWIGVLAVMFILIAINRRKPEPEILKCCFCSKQPLTDDDDPREFEEAVYCEACYDSLFFGCDECGETTPINDGESSNIDGCFICPACKRREEYESIKR